MDATFWMVAITPNSAVDIAAQWVQSKGWGDSAGDVPLSQTGHGPATHWAGVSIIGQEAMAILENPIDQDAALLEVVQIRVQESQNPIVFVDEVLAELGLQMVQDE